MLAYGTCQNRAKPSKCTWRSYTRAGLGSRIPASPAVTQSARVPLACAGFAVDDARDTAEHIRPAPCNVAVRSPPRKHPISARRGTVPALVIGEEAHATFREYA